MKKLSDSSMDSPCSIKDAFNSGYIAATDVDISEKISHPQIDDPNEKADKIYL